MRAYSRKKRDRGQDDLIRLSLLYRIAPHEVDGFMTGSEAAAVIDYLNRYPQLEDVCDTQIARLIQTVSSAFGSKTDINDIRMRGTQKTEEDVALEWIAWIDRQHERKNRTTNQL